MVKRAARAEDKLLPNFTKFFFDKPRLTAGLFLFLSIFGILSYTTWLKREGFPSITIPIAVITGTYGSTDPAEVDAKVTKPLSAVALKQPHVKSVTANSSPNFVSVSVQYAEGTDAKKATAVLQKAVKDDSAISSSARLQYSVPYFGATGGDIDKVDLAISFYDRNQKHSTAELAEAAGKAAAYLQARHIANVERVYVKEPFRTSLNPATGQEVRLQGSFDRFGESEYDTVFFNSVIIAVAANKGTDVIKLDENVRQALASLQAEPAFKQYETRVSASFAPSIKDNISELQRVLLEGLVAVLIVGSIVIAVRASIITVLSMASVIAITIGLLYVLGYTLNVITLFALILGLSLVVDDTIIMVEAIDAARRKLKTPQEVIVQASKKVSRAMVAATTTAALSFAPLLFVGGVLGSFIRAIPVTIISALLISLLVALVFIPLFARFLLLGKKQMGEEGVREVAANFEAKIARGLALPMLWARGSSSRLVSVGVAAAVIGLSFILAGLFIAKDVVFNIFPPSKDSNALSLSIKFKPGTNIEQAQTIAGQVDAVTSQVLGENFVQSSYYGTGNTQTAMQQIEITNYQKRSVTAPELVKKLQDTFDASFTQASVSVGQVDAGPPASNFVIRVVAENRPAAFHLANDIAAYLKRAELKRPNGKVAHFTSPTITSPELYMRVDGSSVIMVSAGFDGTDTSTLTTLAQSAIKDAFPAEKIQSYGLSGNDLSFDLGQESENQDSFKALALAFPILMLVIYLLLSLQFRSLLQPLLIFTALPFSIFGIMLGLRLTHNPISFFSMLGFFALIGLSIKNTILLTDFANQSRRAGNGPIDAAVAALEERFRPLVATSATAVVSLIPLAISSPFWQGLAVVLIFGLVSSTLLVVTVFPYYYLAAEFLRIHTKRRRVL